jgi:sugar lactone lactonase YvrE
MCQVTDRYPLLLSLALACVPAAVDTASDSEAGGSTGAGSTTATTGPAARCEPFEPYVIDVQAEPNGLHYRADEEALYIADDDMNRVLVRADDGALSVFAEIPNPSGDPGSDGLGDLDFAADGSLYVPRFGFGMPGLGAIFRVPAGGAPEQLAGVDADWRRIGLDYDDGRGLLYVATYSRDADDVYTGWVAGVDPVGGGEATIVEGLSKPVGLAVIGDELYVGDQVQRRLYRVDLTATSPALALVSDEFESLDLMEATPDGDLLVLSYDSANSTGRVYRVTPEGSITTVAEGAWEPRGIAFDGVSRIFVSARDTQTIVVVPAC